MSKSDTHTDVSLQRDTDYKPVLRFERRFDQSAERLWQALTTSAELAVWSPWGTADIDLVPGGRIVLTFPGATEGEEGEVLEAVRPFTFAFTGGGESMRWEISERNPGCVLVLTHSVADKAHAPYTAAGYHVCFDQLDTFLTLGADAVERQEMPPPSDLVEHYKAELPALE